LHRIYGRELAEKNIDLTGTDPRSIRLYNQGREVPILVQGEEDGVFDPDDYLEFFGKKKKYDLSDRFDKAKNSDLYYDPFTRYNVYWISWGSGLGLRMVEESGEIRTTDPREYFQNSFYVATVHFEKDNSFDALSTVDVNDLSFYRDHYFFDRGVAQGRKNEYFFELESPLQYSGGYDTFVGMKILLNGITTVSQVSHGVNIFLNNTLVFQNLDNWYKQDYLVLEDYTNIKNIMFKDGANNLEISVPDQGYTDQVALNWFEISYLRAYTARNNQIRFRISPEADAYPDRAIQQFVIDGFTDPDINIYKIGLSRIQNFIKESYIHSDGTTRYRIRFQDGLINKDVEYFAVAGQKRLAPTDIVEEIPTFAEDPGKTLYDTDNVADYLIIAHQNFKSFAEDYARYRAEKNGFITKVVTVDNIYDEFNYGNKSPVAVKDFISYAYYYWNQDHKLRYVLFIGDADSKYKDEVDKLTDFIPTFLFQTYKRGASASDHEYALLEGTDFFNQNDPYADIFIGRIPVSSNNELQAYFNKVKEYESEEEKIGEWTSRSLFISGNDSRTPEVNLDGGPAFRSQNTRIIKSQILPGMATYRLNTVKNDTLDADPDFGGTVTLANYFNDGLTYVNFLGHGGGGIWADVNLMNLSDVDRLLNKGKYPFITSMTCFTGQFESNSTPGLMEKMVLAQDKGAIGAFASSGLGWVQNDYAILWDFVTEIMYNRYDFGQTMVRNKAYYYLYHQYYADDFALAVDGFGFLGKSMVHQYNLIGDPAVTINLPDENIASHLADDLFVDVPDLKIVLADPKWENSSGYYQVTDPEKRPVFERPLAVSGSDTVYIAYSDTFRYDMGYVNLYLNNGQTDGIASYSFAIDNAVIDTIIYSPQLPETFKPIDITWKFNTQIPVSSVKFKYLRYSDIELQKTGLNEFRLPEPLGPFSERKTVVYSLELTFEDGTVQRYSGLKFDVVNNRPNLEIKEESVKISGGEKIVMEYTVTNTGLVDADSFKVALFVDNNIIAFDSLALKGREEKLRSFDYPYTILDGEKEVKIYADYYNDIQEPIISDNIITKNIFADKFYLSRSIGTSYDGARNDTISFSGIIDVYAGQNTISGISTISVDTSVSAEPDAQYTVIPFAGSGLQQVRLILDNNSAELLDSISVALNWDRNFVASRGFSQKDVSLFSYNPKFGQWVKSNVAVLDTITGKASARTINYSGFAFFIERDANNPYIEVTVDGYSLNKGNESGRNEIYVSRKPKFSFIFQDDHGIKIGDSRFTIVLDGNKVDEDELIFEGAVESSKTIGLTYYPELSVGDHTLLVRVEDVNGNLEERTYSFRVDSNFRFEIIGVFPNPFDLNIYPNVYIQFNLTQPVSPADFKVTLYTLGGRKIRTFTGNDVLSSAGTIQQINALPWDGLDRDGNEVANGVYFLKFDVKSEEGNRIEKTVKIAKIR
jgi:hypothetical protein